MKRRSSPITKTRSIAAFLICAAVLCIKTSALGQDDYTKDRTRAIELCEQNKFAEARPILERLHKLNPKDIVVIEKLANTLVAAATIERDEKARGDTLLRARGLAVEAKKLGDESNFITLLLERIPADGKTAESKYSGSKEADEAMKQA